MITVPRRPSLAVAALAAAVAAAAPASASAKRPEPDLSKVPKLKAIPAELKAAFPVLDRPRARKLPHYMRAAFTSPHTLKEYGTDPRQTRAVYGVKGAPWFVVPGRRGICVMISAGGSCAPTAQAVTRGVGLFRMKPGDPRTTFVGFAPTGVTALQVTLRSGATATGALGPFNTYRLDVEEPFTQVALTREGAEPVVIYPGAP
jgi:hypothetical protein